MAFTFVQSAKSPDDTPLLPPSATFDDAPTPGNLMVATVLMDSVSGTPDLDDLVLIYSGWTTDIGPVGVPAADNRLQAMWVIHKMAGASESATVAPVLHRISTNLDDHGFIVIAEYDTDGVTPGVSVSDGGSFSGPSDSATLPALIPTAGQPALIVMLVGHEPNYNSTASSGWTVRNEVIVGGSRQAIALVDQIIPAASGAYTGSMSVSGVGESKWFIPSVAYGTSPEPGVWVDWDNDGFTSTGVEGSSDGSLARMLPEGGSGTSGIDNITADVMSFTWNRGGVVDLVSAAQPGSASIIVKNPTAKYTPDNPASPLFGKLKPGHPVWIGANQDGTLVGSGETIYGVFAGYLRKVVPLPSDGLVPTAELICEDPLGWYARQPVTIPDSTTRSQYDLRVAVLDAINESAGRRNLDPEGATLPLSSADVTNALNLLAEINAANGTRDYARPHPNKDTWYKYTTRARMHGLGQPVDVTLSGSDRVTAMSGYEVTDDTVLNRQRAVASPVSFPNQISDVWTYADAPLTVNGNVRIWANFDDYVTDPLLVYVSGDASVTAPPVVPPTTTTTGSTGHTATIPPSIDSSGSSDAMSGLATFFDNVPAGATIYWPVNGIYRLDTALKLKGKQFMTWEMQGCSLRAHGTGYTEDYSPVYFQSFGGPNHDIIIRNGDFRGTSPTPGAFISGHEGQHGILIDGGYNFEVTGCTGQGFFGDFVEVNSGASNVHGHHNHVINTGRNGLSVIYGNHVEWDHNTLDTMGYMPWDVEPNASAQSCFNIDIHDELVGTWTNAAFAVDGSGTGALFHDISVRNNTITGGSLLTVVTGPGRKGNVTFTGNVGTGSASTTFEHVDGLIVQHNTGISSVIDTDCSDTHLTPNP